MSTDNKIEDPEFYPGRKFLGRPKKYHSEEELKASAIKNLRVYRKQKQIPSDEKYFMSEKDRQNLLLTLDYLQTQLDIMKDVIKSYTHKIVIPIEDDSKMTIQKIQKTAIKFIEEKFAVKEEITQT